MFGHGRLMNSPATFQQGHAVLFSSWSGVDCKANVLKEVAAQEEFWNSISGLVLPDLSRVGKDAIAAKEDWMVTQPPSGIQWPSIYVGIDVIVNQETLSHLDKISAPSLLDLLVSLGTHDAQFHILDLSSIFSYQPGTMIYLAGKLLHHSVHKWEKGERIALAHYMKAAVHNKFGVARPAFTQQKDLLAFPVLQITFFEACNKDSPKSWAEAPAENLNFSDFPNSDWNDVEDVPPTRRFTRSQNDFIREWLPWRTEYLNVILEGEQLAKGGICEQCCQAEGSIQCMSCTGVHAWCGPCAVKVHRNLPFHKVQRWNGNHYQDTSLMELGFLWHVGHGGGGVPCSQAQENPNTEESGYVSGEGPPNYSCPGSDPIDWHLSLLRERLFPASISKPKTAFTFDVLNHFLIDALECKTSAMSFYQKLKRFTNNAFPGRVPVECHLPSIWIGNGLGLVMIQNWIQEKGDLPSSVLPAPNQELIYLLIGKLDEKGYVVSEIPYQSHLQQSLDNKEAGGGGPVAAITGQAMLPISTSPTFNPLELVLQHVLSMIALFPIQWWTFKKGKGLEIIPAVGKFHLAAHKLSCFPRYSLNFFKGAGHLDGEILETLWAPFNKISPTARSMTQAHRQEVYDDHMRDSKWKKLVGIVPSLLKKYKTSNKCLEDMNQAYEQLNAALDPNKVAQWELDALKAEADHGEALDIYLLRGDKAPTFHEAQLNLGRNPVSSSGNLGSVAWLAEGIRIEDSWDQLRYELHQLPSLMSTRQEVKTSEKRQRLSSRIEEFHSTGQAFLKGLEIDGAFIPQDDPAFCGQEDQEKEDGEFWEDDDGVLEAPDEEVQELASSIGAAKLMELCLHDLLKEEMELRIGQANDCSKAMLYRQNFRTANSTREGTSTKREIQKVVVRINKHVRSYQRARKAILRLDLNDNIGEKYQEIKPEDLAVSKEVTEENRFGQGVSKMAWFWVVDGEQNQLNVDSGGLMEEYVNSLLYQLAQSKGKKRQMERRSVIGEA
ncbi:hypothetical protein EDC04DRAFT_2602333 [Pisolithus marmoratus]|nr:hypothetical protein EDC04DRAFT_2602333 [Pisolithus marmoratus]